MRYPITPEFISELPNKLAAIYIRLETFILEDICERLKTSGTVTETAIEQIKTLQRRGYTFAHIEKAVKETLELSDREYENLWNDAVERNKKYFDAVIDKNTLAAASFDKKTFEDEINAIERQTAGELKNITQSLGFAVRQGGGKVTFLPVAETYQKVLDDALMKVQSGTGSYNTAIREAVKQLTDSGLQVIDYQTGWHNRVDVAVRRAVMTGVSQLSAKYSEREAEILGADLFEVSAHKGARDTDKPNPWSNHKAWQGKVYSRSGKSDLYPSIISVCGLGQPDGLTGINCRHMYFPFIEGVSERTYTDKELENIDGEPFAYQGKTYTAYEATQKQRQIETAIRQCKRECIAADAREDREYYTDCSVRLRRLKDEYNSFSKAAKLPMQSERANIAAFGSREGRKSENEYKAVAKNKSRDRIIEEIKKAGNISKAAIVNIPRLTINTETLTFDDNHINQIREHNVSIEEAIRFIKEAQISITVWNGKYERYIGYRGCSYVDKEKMHIRTTFRADEYDSNMLAIIEVLKKYGL